jgi:intergrase/recombinase
MKTHQAIDRRSLELARQIVAKIDADRQRQGHEHAKMVCRRWFDRGNRSAKEWLEILDRPWEEVREILLDESDEGQRLRQNNPFCGVLTPKERWAIYREAARSEAS